MTLKNHSVRITNMVRDLTNAAHEASGLLAARAEDSDAMNFMAVFEKMATTEKHAFIEWLHRTME